MAEIVVVGGGMGGMAAALRLATRGHAVQVIERRDELGGKLAVRRCGDFTFPIGPSLLTWPQVFDDLTSAAGHRLADLVDLVPVDPICRYRFADRSRLDASADAERMGLAVERLAPGQGAAWRRFHERGERCWEASARSFFGGPPTLRSLASRGGSRGNSPGGSPGGPRDVAAVDPLRTLAGRAARSFSDPRLRQYVARYATYAGSSPYRAPAALQCVPYLEQAFGAWYVRGGLIKLRDVLADLLAEAGVTVRTGTAVTAVLADRRRVRGVGLANGDEVEADAVVANVDAYHLYRDLLPHAARRRRVERLGRSTSAFLVLAGVRGHTEGLAHHNVFFSPDYREEFTDIFGRGRPPRDPTVYLGCSSRDDPSQAPDGYENWVLLVNVPAAPAHGWPCSVTAYGDTVLERLATRGLDASGRLAFREHLTPDDFAERYGAWGGAIYGTPLHGRTGAFRRPGNRGPRRGLYLVGGSTHPGGGLPLVARSGEIVADLVQEDFEKDSAR